MCPPQNAIRSITTNFEREFPKTAGGLNDTVKLFESPEVTTFIEECEAATTKAFNKLPPLTFADLSGIFPCSWKECNWVIRGDNLVLHCKTMTGQCMIA